MCRDLFGENVDPSALLESLANDSVLGTIQAGPISNPAISAQTSPNLGAYFSYKGNGKFVGPISTFTGATITVNSNPAASFSAGYPGPSSLGFDPSTSHAITVIHELGHAANFTYGSGASVIANDGPTGVGAQLSRINTILVANNCFGGPR